MPTTPEHDNKAAFLERVRTALGRSAPLAHTPDHSALKTTAPRQAEKVRTILAKNEARRERTMARLAENAAAASWTVHRVNTPQGAASTVVEIAARSGAKTAVRTAEDIFKLVDIDGPLRQRGIAPAVLASGGRRRRADLKRLAFAADIGMAGVTYAVAETASCVITPR